MIVLGRPIVRAEIGRNNDSCREFYSQGRNRPKE